jgi:hypothetical protein
MKRLVVIVAGAIAVAAGAAVLYPRQDTEQRSTHHVCRVCGSYRVTHTNTVDGVTVRTWVEARPSAAFTDLLGDGHEHDWAFGFSNSVSRVGWFTRVHEHGDGFPHYTGRMPNRFTAAYNESGDFQALVKGRIEAGEISRDLAGHIVQLEDVGGASDGAAKARELLARRR